ncbi:MAG TPA: glycosyltransferase family A protein [Myxococcota bacterium]|nr:glycosyltransferase family A protein [Myxococcota bacterium]
MISVIVVVHDMLREAPRTLFSLATPHQRGIEPGDYEVIVVENVSDNVLGEALVCSFGPQFRYFARQVPDRSPAAAVNFGVVQARGTAVALYVDGARIASPGLLRTAAWGLTLAPRPLVASLGWHLGPDAQYRSMREGYNQEVEDRLLAAAGWEQDGYNLFEVATLGDSSRRGYFAAPAESNALFLPRALFDELGGFDPRFVSVGGGFVNGDFFVRACEASSTTLVMLLGEGTFHQIHGGASTNVLDEARTQRLALYGHEYERLRGRPFAAPTKDAIYLGRLPPQGMPSLRESVRYEAPRPRRAGRSRAIVPIVFCVDAEPDEFKPRVDDRSAWNHVEVCLSRLEAYRERLSEATGRPAAFTWAVRADPQLETIYGNSAWGLQYYRAEWRRLADAGDDVALHPHPQRWCEARGRWYGGQEDAGWAEHVLHTAHAGYLETLETLPQTLRFGNRYMTTALARTAEALGFRHDLTLEPGYAGRTPNHPNHAIAGPCPSYLDAPREPYQASRDDCLLPADVDRDGMWMIPMSTSPVVTDLPFSERDYWRFESAPGQAYETLHLCVAPTLFERALERTLMELGRPYLAVVIRCDMVHQRETWENLETLRRHPWARHFAFTTAGGLLTQLGYLRARPARHSVVRSSAAAGVPPWVRHAAEHIPRWAQRPGPTLKAAIAACGPDKLRAQANRLRGRLPWTT